MVFAPLAALVLWATFRPDGPDTDLLACIVAGLCGMAGIVAAPWREPVKVALAGVYMLAALVAVPILRLVALLIVARA